MTKSIINVDGKFYKKSKVAMLPTEKASNIKLVPKGEYDGINNKILKKDILYYVEEATPYGYPSQHLYILSDDEILVDDWVYTKNHETQKFVIEKIADNYTALVSKKIAKKIIASNDPELKLPRPKDSFIKKYCELGGIDEVLVEYEDKGKYVFYGDHGNGHEVYKPNWVLKLAPDNTISIKPVKEIWNREEVKKLLIEAWEEAENCIMCKLEISKNYQILEERNNWIEENL